MSRPTVRPLLLVIALLAIFAAACGIEAGEQLVSGQLATTDPTSATTAPEDQPLGPDQDQARQPLVDTYVELGLSEKEAGCLADAMLSMMDETGNFDTARIMDAVNQCDIPMSRLGEIGANAGGSLEDGMKFGLETSLRNQGLSDTDASCVADAYVAEFGTDPSGVQDPSTLNGLFETCNVDPSTLGG